MSEPEVGRLSRAQFAGCFLLVVGIFVVSRGLVWQDPWDVARLDGAIFISYAPIPLLVIACLAWSRRLGWRSAFLETLTLTFAKYVTTFAIALIAWACTDPPRALAGMPAPRAGVRTEATKEQRDEAPPAAHRTLSGEVLDEDGAPASGALLYIQSSAITQKAPLESLELEHRAGHLWPDLAVAVAGQTMVARSSDGRMHTILAETTSDAALFNVPMIRSGDWTRVTVPATLGPARLRCTVHPGEPASWLVVVPNRLFTVTGADGRFTLERVPRVAVSLAAWRAAPAQREARLELAPEAEGSDLALRLAAR